MREEIKIGLAEDQPLFRDGLVKILNSFDKVSVEFFAADGKEFIEKLENHEVDIAFLDYKMPELNGPQTAEMIRLNFPKIKILFISMFDSEEFVVNAIESGAHGYITKDQDVEEIELAIDSLVNTGYYMNDKLSRMLIGNLVSSNVVKPKFNNEDVKLNETEIAIIKLICQEYNTKEIAKMVFKGVRTVEGIRSNILKKIGAKNSSGIFMFAVKNGIIKV